MELVTKRLLRIQVTVPDPVRTVDVAASSTPRMHRVVLHLRSFDPERDSDSYNALFVFVADLDNDDMVRGIQRHLLGDLSRKVHSMSFGRTQVFALRPDTIRTKAQPLADVEIVTRHGCASTVDLSHNARSGAVFAVTKDVVR